MTLQNRVDPWGRLVADPGRGTMTGNRGILHDEHRAVVRQHTSNAWITCELHWRNRRRPVMTGRTWTELFFLDEATALAAGHRPCAYCRRADYLAFVDAWSVGNPALAPTTGRRAPVVDAALHRERRLSDGTKRTTARRAAELPVGAMFEHHARAWLVSGDDIVVPWSFTGYGGPERLLDAIVSVLTPASTVAALRSGYRPRFHHSVSGAPTL